MRPELPLEILGLIAPILAQVTRLEGHVSAPDPRLLAWSGSAQGVNRERSWLLKELPTYSLDIIDEVLNFGRQEEHQALVPSVPRRERLIPPERYDLRHTLETLAQRYFVWNGGEVAVRSQRMVELHELGLRFPMGPVIRHMHARAVMAGEQSVQEVLQLPESVGLLPSNAHNLRAVVRRGLSEGHLHLNSIHSAEVAWADHLLRPLRQRPSGFNELDWGLLRLGRAASRVLALATLMSFHERRLREGWGIDFRLDHLPDAKKLLTSFDRMYLARDLTTLAHWEARIERQIFQCFPFIYQMNEKYLSAFRGVLRAERSVGMEGLGIYLLRWLDHGGERFLHWLGETKGRLAAETLEDRERHLESFHLCIHVALLLTSPKKRRGNTRQESLTRPSIHAFLSGALFRYLVCFAQHWKLGVQQGRTTGLQYFRAFYNSSQRWPLGDSARVNAEAVLARARSWRGLRVLEGRIGPPSEGLQEVLPWLEAYARRPDQGRVGKFGLVVHFIKDHDPGLRKPNWELARYTALRRRYRRDAFRLFRLLETPSLASPFFVGIDAANLELTTPPEVFAPVFRFLRSRPIELREPETPDIETWRRLDDIKRLVDRRRLGMTFHVGEEFRHLLSGLRAIDEVLEFLGPVPGDRIGHGIALGLQPKVWAEQVGFQAVLSKQEWLDTLVWIHHFLGPGDDVLGRLDVEGRIQRLARELYVSLDVSGRERQSRVSITPLQLLDAWRLRQLDPDNVTFPVAYGSLQTGADGSSGRHTDSKGSLGFRLLDGLDTATWRWNRTERDGFQSLEESIGVNPPWDLLYQYWYRPETAKEGAELMLVDMEKEAEEWLTICARVQQRLQGKVSNAQVAVEVNPSANRVIGPMSRIEDHHVFDLTCAEGGLNGKVHVTVNTDNPGTTNTSLAHEYYLLGESLIRRGERESDVVQWLEWLRGNGRDYSFVRQMPGLEDPSMHRVVEDLKRRRRPFHGLEDAEAVTRDLWKWMIETAPKDRNRFEGQRSLRERLHETETSDRRPVS